ncbi:hypothetical protein GR268_47035, partial [Rhizobium leguminosarum]|nr:hypothetical protein [Rhizobium leguminosarum]
MNYKQEVSWGDSDANSLQSLLQPTVYKGQSTYDALGRVIQDIDIDGNSTVPTYHLSGLLDQIKVTTADDQKTKQVVQGITYNAKGQRLKISYGNTTTSSYSYDPKTWALTNLKTVNTKGKVLQDLIYVYDPV